ncbi:MULTISPECIES: hypothetical protein [unclassified Novosphingobium]|uniref:hypothetical protein n=1 Tax=unclassified Novosphingobium TaxID=2644732 RepID=UPI000D496946|nr:MULTISPECIES: hypothetical protein [unclassified Novosphingobium]PTR11767.1 hypothetical protein C8K11_104126 [Novosphingobium sp. GV055]PUB04807.1 hypothetical protein C8K12_104126 [Novosphingobium sp. GV061]PUB21126.1 hypothetical protein C8K14_104126 [Novosphingobium sp. GV079]PUB42852.1 hypothetical protein C8K10_104126 [Novosphingobium sp. GV027]
MDEVAAKTGAAMEAVKAMLDAMKAHGADARGLAVCRTQFETAFLWAGVAVCGEPIL